MPPGLGRWVVLAGKIAVSATLLYLLWSNLPEKISLPVLAQHGIWLFLFALLLEAVKLALLSVRWARVTQLLMPAGLPLTRYFSLTWVSSAISQVLPALVAGDGYRIAGLQGAGLSWGNATRSVLADRIVGFIGLGLLMLLWGVSEAQQVASWLLHPASLVLLGGIAALLLGTVVAMHRHGVTAQLQLTETGSWLAFILLAVAGHLLGVLQFVTISKAFSVHLPLETAILVLPTAFFMAMIPVSFGGWGVREAAVVYGFSRFGLAPEDALLASVVFGMFQICAGLPSALLLLANWGARHRQ